MRPNLKHMAYCTMCRNFAPICCSDDTYSDDTYIKCIDCCNSKIQWDVSPLERLAWTAMEQAE